jgi:hypothetical protein
MGDIRSLVAQYVEEHGAAAAARLLDVSRASVLGYVTGTSREATRIVIEQRAERLAPADGAQP